MGLVVTACAEAWRHLPKLTLELPNVKSITYCPINASLQPWAVEEHHLRGDACIHFITSLVEAGESNLRRTDLRCKNARKYIYLRKNHGNNRSGSGWVNEHLQITVLCNISLENAAGQFFFWIAWLQVSSKLVVLQPCFPARDSA